VGVFGVVMKKFIDAHCHLFNSDLPDNIGAIVNATNPADWRAVIECAHKNASAFGAIGVHPWYVADLADGWDVCLRDLLVANPDIMVGEIGLDKHKPDMDLQLGVFARQLEIAAELGRGAHVHCVGAWDKMFEVLKVYKSKMPPFMLFHRFSGNGADVARLVADYNAYFSFRDVCDVICDVPSARVLIETDSYTPAQIVAVADNFSWVCPGCDFYENTMGMLKNG
jgi:TatD DNase family protein